MWDMILKGLVSGAAAGAAKTMMEEPQRQAQNKYEAQTMALSPWTGLQSKGPQYSKGTENMLQGAMTGAMMGQQYGIAESQKDLLDAQTKLLASRAGVNAAGSPVTGAMSTPRIANQGQLTSAMGNINAAVPGLNMQNAYTPMQYQSMGGSTVPPVSSYNKWWEDSMGPTTVNPYYGN